MSNHHNPCGQCTQGVCDYRRCDPYRQWLNTSWKQFQRHIRHDYWGSIPKNGNQFAYVHPDLIRRYLHDGPCALCECAEFCDIPCESYRCWWDARMAWLRWKLEHVGM